MQTERRPHTQPLHSRQDDKWAWALMATLSAVLLIEVGFPLLLNWLWPVGGR